MFRRTACLLLLLAFFPSVLLAQARIDTRASTRRKSRSKTIVSVEILADKRASGLTRQQWGRTFEEIGYAVRIRQAILKEKPEIKETKLGRLRQVKAIGKLDRRGTLIFPDRTFSPSDGAKLAEWLRSLEVYGAQGSPRGQPVWGLNQTQFEILFNALSKKLTVEVQGKTIEAALKTMALPDDYQVRYTTAAREWLSDAGLSGRPIREELKGHSKGTALALALSESGLGFRPQRTPGGGVEISIESSKAVSNLWPIGWDLKLPRSKTAPQMFKLIPVELDDVKLIDALVGISVLTKLPIHLDRAGIEAAGIDVDEIVVSYPSRKTSWSLLLRSITTPHKLTRKFRIDELGQPFVWITALKPGRAGE